MGELGVSVSVSKWVDLHKSVEEAECVEHAPPCGTLRATLEEISVRDRKHQVTAGHVSLESIRGLVGHLHRILQHRDREMLRWVAGEP